MAWRQYTVRVRRRARRESAYGLRTMTVCRTAVLPLKGVSSQAGSAYCDDTRQELEGLVAHRVGDLVAGIREHLEARAGPKLLEDLDVTLRPLQAVRAHQGVPLARHVLHIRVG